MADKNQIEALQLMGKATAQHAARHKSVLELLGQTSTRVMELISLASRKTPQALAAQLTMDTAQKPGATKDTTQSSSASAVRATGKPAVVKQKPSTRVAGRWTT